MQALYFLCGTIVTAAILSNLFKYLLHLVIARFRISLGENLREVFFSKLLKLDLQFFITNKKGDLLSRGSSDILEMEQLVDSSFKALIKEPLMILALFAVLFKIDAELTLYTLIILPIAGFTISFLVQRLKKSALNQQQALGKMQSVLEESLSSMRVIKLFNLQKVVRSKHRSTLREYTSSSYRIAKTMHLAPPTSEVLGSITIACLLLVGGNMIFQPNSAMSPEVFIGFMIIFSQILAPAKSFSKGLSSINKALAASERIFTVLDTPENDRHQLKAPHMDFSSAIEFKNVYFTYEKNPVLRSVSFRLEKGKTLGLVGPSGAGKTTITDLLSGLYKPTKGQILIDGRDISLLDPRSLQKHMAAVTQDVFLYHDSVAKNIAFGRDHATEKEIIAAAKVANAHDFIDELPDGYHTIIGERGAKLSGGQQQRISIARAVLRNPSILILDEATSSLDASSEKEVQDALSNLMRDRTIIIIAHRLSSVIHADEIIVLENGSVIERGTHKELADSQGAYKRQLDLQTI